MILSALSLIKKGIYSKRFGRYFLMCVKYVFAFLSLYAIMNYIRGVKRPDSHSCYDKNSGCGTVYSPAKKCQ